ncbi:MAG: type II toxin-antitoxin system RelE/ParE family toxin [Chloroflexi bacterium]|nr:type II toxin-antitoxin system RelE/ParE family toxin [Chloroflexota bacterium]
MPQVIRTPEARTDLVQIWLYIAQNSASAADRILDNINRVSELIASQPFMGRSREELAPGLRSFPVGNYMIFYRSVEDGIEVVRVINAARDIESLF